MKFKELDTVVLERDMPEHALRKGDLGAIMHVYEPDAVEVEFVTESGQTHALLPLAISDLRAASDDDLRAAGCSVVK